jgi:hypothetical protein
VVTPAVYRELAALYKAIGGDGPPGFQVIVGVGVYKTGKDAQAVGINNLCTHRDLEFLDHWSDTFSRLLLINPPSRNDPIPQAIRL